MKKLDNLREFMNFTGQEEMNPEFMGYDKKDSSVNAPQEKPIDFTVSGVSDSAVQMICSLISMIILNSAEAEKIARMIKNNPSSSITFLDKKVDNIIQSIPVEDERLKRSLASQTRKISEYVSRAITPIAYAMTTDTQIDPEEIKPTATTIGTLGKIKDIFKFGENPQDAM